MAPPIPDPNRKRNVQAPPVISREQYLSSMTPTQRAANIASTQSALYNPVNPAQPQQYAPAAGTREQQMVNQLTGVQQPQPSYIQAGQQAGVLPQPQQAPAPQPSAFEQVAAALRSPFDASQRTPEAIQANIAARGQMPTEQDIISGLPEAALMAAPIPAGAIGKAAGAAGKFVPKVSGKIFGDMARNVAEAEAMRAASKTPGWIASQGRVISQGEMKGLLGAVKAGKANMPALINRFGADNVRQAMFQNADEAFKVAEGKSSSLLEKIALESGSNTFKAAAGNVAEKGVNTASEKVFKNWLGQFARGLAAPKTIAAAVVAGTIGATIYGWSMTGNEAGDVGMAVGIAGQMAAEAGDMEAKAKLEAYGREANELLNSWKSVVPFMSIFTARKLENIKGQIGLLQLELSMKQLEANEKKWKDLAEKEAAAETANRAFWEKQATERKEEKETEKSYWEEQTAEKRAYDEAVRAYWEGVNAEKQRQKAEDRAYWEGVERKRERDAWDEGYSNLNFGLL